MADDPVLRTLMELRWRREVIERWLDFGETPAESKAQFREMLAQVNLELEAVEAMQSVVDSGADVERDHLTRSADWPLGKRL